MKGILNGTDDAADTGEGGWDRSNRARNKNKSLGKLKISSGSFSARSPSSLNINTAAARGYPYVNERLYDDKFEQRFKP